jgi:hypothetical protein
MYITDEIKQLIFSETNGGLDILIKLFPNASVGAENENKKFTIRTEKTPSAKLKKQADNTWVLTDFGSDSKGKNAITWVMEEKKLDFNEACNWILDQFNIQVEGQKPKSTIRKEFRPANSDEENGLMTFQKRKFTIDELREMFAPSLMRWVENVFIKEGGSTQKEELRFKRCFDVLTKYGWSALDSYTITKEGKTHTFHSDQDNPFFLMEDGEFCKLYQPKNKDKGFRFLYYPKDKFPKDHVWGLKQAKKEYERLQKQIADKSEAEAIEGGKEQKYEVSKLPAVILSSGERDSMNVALMGYFPVWQNSETKGLSRTLFKELNRISDHVYNLPDIDTTGVKMGVKYALQHVELKTVWLPFDLLKSKDWRGNPAKDLRDFLAWNNKSKKDFDGLVNTARSCKFWYKTVRTDKNGKTWENWEINDVNLHYFLWCSGFYKIKSSATKDGYQYIKIEGFKVYKVEAKEIRSFVKSYLESHYADHKLLSKFMRSPVLNDSAMEYLTEIEIDFSAFTPKSQNLFFENEIWQITAESIERLSETNAVKQSQFVWEHKVKKHRVDILEPFFNKIEFPEVGIIEAEPINTECLFFQYLLATCRIHWKKEHEHLQQFPQAESERYWKENKHALDSPDIRKILTEDEISEQKQHLANKIYVFGYLLHEYKDQAKPWAAFCIDGILSDEGKSSGRSGKSVFIKGVREVIQTKTISGRYTKITDNPHIYDGVDQHTSLVFVDDCHEFLKYDFFYTALTDTMTVNAKFIRELEIPYEQSPKFGFTTNFAMRNNDPSTLARLIICVFSDFFHEKQDENGVYSESRSIQDWVGKNLFSSAFTQKDWNNFFNFCAQAIKFYLSCNKKLSPPMAEVNLRNQKAEMGDVFFDWAETYFSKESGNLDKTIFKDDLLEHYNKGNNAKWQMRSLTKALKAFAKFKNQTEGFMILNPKSLQNSGGRISRKKDGVTTECIYLQTTPEINLTDTHKTWEDGDL